MFCGLLRFGNKLIQVNPMRLLCVRSALPNLGKSLPAKTRNKCTLSPGWAYVPVLKSQTGCYAHWGALSILWVRNEGHPPFLAASFRLRHSFAFCACPEEAELATGVTAPELADCFWFRPFASKLAEQAGAGFKSTCG